MKRPLIFGISLLTWQLSCQDPGVQKDTRSAGSFKSSNQSATGGPVLRLKWDASTGTTTEYHIYGLTEEKNAGGKEFASLTVTEANKEAPKVDVDLSKTSLPKTGKVCFYIVAENDGAMSSASTPACTKI